MDWENQCEAWIANPVCVDESEVDRCRRWERVQSEVRVSAIGGQSIRCGRGW